MQIYEHPRFVQYENLSIFNEMVQITVLKKALDFYVRLILRQSIHAQLIDNFQLFLPVVTTYVLHKILDQKYLIFENHLKQLFQDLKN